MARSMIAKPSASEVCEPKFIVPRQSGLTSRPERPRCRYSMASVWSRLAGAIRRRLERGLVGIRLPRLPMPGAPSIEPPRHEGVIPVGRRRVLGYAEYGDPTGRLVLWHHGTPGGRRQ